MNISQPHPVQATTRSTSAELEGAGNVNTSHGNYPCPFNYFMLIDTYPARFLAPTKLNRKEE